jgi:hypothetical protein
MWLAAGRTERASAMPRFVAMVLAAAVVLLIVAAMVYSNP